MHWQLNPLEQAGGYKRAAEKPRKAEPSTTQPPHKAQIRRFVGTPARRLGMTRIKTLFGAAKAAPLQTPTMRGLSGRVPIESPRCPCRARGSLRPASDGLSYRDYLKRRRIQPAAKIAPDPTIASVPGSGVVGGGIVPPKPSR